MNLLTILVREAAQNSWDAGLHRGPLAFDIDLTTLPPDIVPRWRDTLSPGAPDNRAVPLRESLRGRVNILTVSDRGTGGLGGPTRADNAIVEDNDFVAFIRNVGEPRDTALGGGTYGFGKGIFYLLSRCGTVLIYTRCRNGKSLESRLIACTLWDSYTVGEGESGDRFTGRHWWGDTSSEIVEPILNEEADRIARRLGLPSFQGNDTGTTISIVDPILDFDFAADDEQEEAAVDWMRKAVMWHLWPKIIPTNDGKAAPMTITVCRNGAPVEIPDPEKTTPLNRFVRAYRELAKPEAKEISAKRPPKFLGVAAFAREYTPPFPEDRVAEECGFSTTSHHVCLMRSPELVVKYLAGPKPGVTFISYAGVFRADDGVDDAFAKSEPPTHDDWVSSQLEMPSRTYINVALRILKELAREQTQVAGAEAGSTAENVPLGMASRRFSALITAGASLTRGESQNGTAGKSSQSSAGGRTRGGSRGKHDATRKPRLTYLGDPYFEEVRDDWLIAQDFRVDASREVDVVPEVHVIVPGARGREREAPVNAKQPEVIGWSRQDGTEFAALPNLRHSGDGGSWRILVKPAPDTGTQIELAARTVESS
ncbi:hypothetical protein ACWDTI_05065 [Gordonia sp. NPDC003424]